MFEFINKIYKNMSNFNLNGTVITAKSIVITNGKVILDGKDVTPDGKEINISVEGDVESMEIDACSTIKISGNTGNIKTSVGDVEVSGAVNGSVQTQSGDINCGDVGGNASTQAGDIDCGSVKGNVSTMAGDIRHK